MCSLLICLPHHSPSTCVHQSPSTRVVYQSLFPFHDCFLLSSSFFFFSLFPFDSDFSSFWFRLILRKFVKKIYPSHRKNPLSITLFHLYISLTPRNSKAFIEGLAERSCLQNVSFMVCGFRRPTGNISCLQNLHFHV
uniref:Uncharacterized protein n=1 Tax=Cucumis melo TaxID=3656 RepID=A0A9I9E748_CUCME